MGHLILVRHSTTAASAGGRNLGQGSDPPLAAAGVALATRLGAALSVELAELPITELRLVSSPARRCRETMAAIARAIGQSDEPELDARLMEINYGAWEGLTPKECADRDPELRAEWEADPFTVQIPDGESGADVAARAFPAFDAIEAWLAADRARTAVVVAHNHVNRLRLTATLGWPMAAYRRRVSQDPAGYSIIRLHGGEPFVRRLNVQPA
ncbi:MAG: histidine phosphatase family protein [Chloroflexota bacterium]|nr:histidine phosphatase family protein [Chloroflexota bacterium]